MFGDSRNIQSFSRKVTHVPVGTTQQMKTSRTRSRATTANPPWPPLSKGAGRRTGGFLPLIGIFIRGREVKEIRNPNIEIRNKRLGKPMPITNDQNLGTARLNFFSFGHLEFVSNFGPRGRFRALDFGFFFSGTRRSHDENFLGELPAVPGRVLLPLARATAQKDQAPLPLLQPPVFG